MKILLAIILLLPNLALAAPCHVTLHTDASVTTTSAQALPLNGNRRCLIAQNKGSQTVTCKLGSVQSSTEGFQLVAGATWEPENTPVDAVYCYSASGTQTVDFMEGITP